MFIAISLFGKHLLHIHKWSTSIAILLFGNHLVKQEIAARYNGGR
jgi:hypothetical protein